MKRIVYASEEPLRWKNDKLVRRVNLDPAEEYGELRFVFDHAELEQDSTRELLWKARERMSEFTFNDYVVIVGSLVGTVILSHVATERTGGRVRLLEWERDESRYRIRDVDLTAQPLDVPDPQVGR